jgi:uncharacterized protein YebE (UPF0316 family)
MLLDSLLSALLIFGLRTTDITLATLRLLMVMRSRKLAAWVLGFFQALVFVIAISKILSDIGNWLNLIGYAAGFATGNVVGMFLEERLALGHTHLRIISSHQGPAIVERLRSEGYGVTEIPARGKDGMVTLLNCSVQRRRLGKARQVIEQIDPEAFITSEDVRALQHGFWGEVK